MWGGERGRIKVGKRKGKGGFIESSFFVLTTPVYIAHLYPPVIWHIYIQLLSDKKENFFCALRTPVYIVHLCPPVYIAHIYHLLYIVHL